jgi:hypothetical protein
MINRIPVNRRCQACLLGVAICIMFLLGCEDRQQMKDPKASLEALAAEYWKKRLLEKDYKATYEMEVEKGKSLPFEKYLLRVRNVGQIHYISIKIKDVIVKEDKGEVQLTVRCKLPPLAKELEMPLPDRWVVKSNQWRHVLPKE